MMVLVDTSVWSRMLSEEYRLNRLVCSRTDATDQEYEGSDAWADPPGNSFQIRTGEQFVKVREQLRPFSDLLLVAEDYEYAAELFNLLRGKGIQGSNTDFLICAVSLRYKLPIFTTDKDFDLFARHIPLQLYAML